MWGRKVQVLKRFGTTIRNLSLEWQVLLIYLTKGTEMISSASLRRLDNIQGKSCVEPDQRSRDRKRPNAIRPTEKGWGFKSIAINLSFIPFYGPTTDMDKQSGMEINQANVKIASGDAHCIYPVKFICV